MGLVVDTLSVDCAAPRRLAEWWAQVLGWQVLEDEDPEDDEVAIGDPARSPLTLLFLQVPEAKTSKNRLHLDLRPPDGSDQHTELRRLLALGARRIDVGQSADVSWLVLADPEGNEFCLLESTPAELAAELGRAGTGSG
jgi:hypothetical protein